MKNFSIFPDFSIKTAKFLALTLFVSSAGLSIAHEKIISKEELPLNSQKFIADNFSNLIINYATVENKRFSKEYEIKFNNRFEIEFDENGNWTEIDGKKQAIPTTFIQKNILDYVKTNFPNSEIVKIEKKNYKRNNLSNQNNQRIKLSNGLKLNFDLNGNLSTNNQKLITQKEFPLNAQTFISENFNDLTIDYSIINNKKHYSKYKVRFTDGIEIKFDENGNWQEVEGKTQAISTKFIDKNILDYVNSNFQNAQITEIEKKKFNKQKIKLSNGAKLMFDSQGKIINFD